jgi:indole-3-glycerol phosphate synthase
MAATSRARVGDLRAREPLALLRARALESAPPPPLRRRAGFDLIAEIKLKSPSAGVLGRCDVAARARAYARGGASAVSVLTEPTRFGGDLLHLADACRALAPHGVPAMRKDFIVDPYQLFETRAAGGGGALLIARLLSQRLLDELIDCARELGLFVLVECFDEDDLERAERAHVRVRARDRGASLMVGVNCRDLSSLAVQAERLAMLASRLPEGAAKVAESGIDSPGDCRAAARAGYDFALVGTALMRSADPASLIAGMLAAGRAA